MKMVGNTPNVLRGTAIGRALRVVALAGCVTGIAACDSVQSQRGYQADARSVEQLQPGVVTKDEVYNILGSPSTRGTFDDSVWYYIGTDMERWAFFEPDMLDRTIIELHFDQAGFLTEVREYGPEIAQDVDPVDRETPTRGNRITFLQQFLGNLGRFND